MIIDYPILFPRLPKDYWEFVHRFPYLVICGKRMENIMENIMYHSSPADTNK